ncbi:MAG: trigger factor, partial [Candidatus Eremiobacteraeota bacterium]|nr:trigger factor [Candidatus Eremiobacteraeota bacterium]
PLRVRATVTVRPQFELHDYKGVELEGTSTAVPDAEVERALSSLRKESATLVPVERPVQLGDVPTIDYEGKIDGVPFDGGTAAAQSTEIAEERFIPGFASGIVGMAAGETKDVEAHFPDDYSNAELAGKTAIFTIVVHENKIAELPELDDELAKRFGGEAATVASLRDELRNRLEAGARQHQRRDMTGELLEKLMSAHEFALPQVLVDRESEHLFDEAKSYVDRSGTAWETYLEEQGKSESDLRDEYRAEASKRVKSSLLIEAIAKAEGIAAGNADVEAEVAQLSRQYGQSREAILEMLRPNFNALLDGIVRTKTVEFLLDHAKVTEVALPANAADAETEAVGQA